MSIIPKSTVTFRIADTPENVRAVLAANTADHVMAGPPPDAMFRGRIEGDRIQLYNALPKPHPRLAPICVTLDTKNGASLLIAKLGPSRQMRFIFWLQIVLLPITLTKVVQSIVGGIWTDSAGVSTYLWLLVFVGAVWGAAV